MTSPRSDTMSVAQLATKLGWCPRTVYAHLRAGHIPAMRVGNRWIILTDRITAWLNGEEG